MIGGCVRQWGGRLPQLVRAAKCSAIPSQERAPQRALHGQDSILVSGVGVVYSQVGGRSANHHRGAEPAPAGAPDEMSGGGLRASSICTMKVRQDLAAREKLQNEGIPLLAGNAAPADRASVFAKAFRAPAERPQRSLNFDLKLTEGEKGPQWELLDPIGNPKNLYWQAAGKHIPALARIITIDFRSAHP